MAKVNTHVYVLVDGQPVLLTPGDDVPEGVEVTNPAVFDTEDDAEDKPAPAKKAPARKDADK